MVDIPYVPSSTRHWKFETKEESWLDDLFLYSTLTINFGKNTLIRHNERVKGLISNPSVELIMMANNHREII